MHKHGLSHVAHVAPPTTIGCSTRRGFKNSPLWQFTWCGTLNRFCWQGGSFKNVWCSHGNIQQLGINDRWRGVHTLWHWQRLCFRTSLVCFNSWGFRSRHEAATHMAPVSTAVAGTWYSMLIECYKRIQTGAATLCALKWRDSLWEGKAVCIQDILQPEKHSRSTFHDISSSCWQEYHGKTYPSPSLLYVGLSYRNCPWLLRNFPSPHNETQVTFSPHVSLGLLKKTSDQEVLTPAGHPKLSKSTIFVLENLSG